MDDRPTSLVIGIGAYLLLVACSGDAGLSTPAGTGGSARSGKAPTAQRAASVEHGRTILLLDEFSCR
jgi:hypothetical protein